MQTMEEGGWMVRNSVLLMCMGVREADSVADELDPGSAAVAKFMLARVLEREAGESGVAAADIDTTDVPATGAQQMPGQLPKGTPTDAQEVANNGQSACFPPLPLVGYVALRCMLHLPRLNPPVSYLHYHPLLLLLFRPGTFGPAPSAPSSTPLPPWPALYAGKSQG